MQLCLVVIEVGTFLKSTTQFTASYAVDCCYDLMDSNGIHNDIIQLVTWYYTINQMLYLEKYLSHAEFGIISRQDLYIHAYSYCGAKETT